MWTRLVKFLKEWTLLVAIVSGIVLYFIYTRLPIDQGERDLTMQVVGVVQPVCIFLMLFLTFCKIDFKDLHYRHWHTSLLLIQGGSFIALCLLLIFFPDMPGKILVEGLSLCLICPTATAAAVVTRKLGGSAENITMYTILINILVSMLIPIFVPLLHPHTHLGFFASAALIWSRVFPLLLFPLVMAWFVRHFLPRLHSWCCKYPDLPFYMWCFTLILAIAVTAQIFDKTQIPGWEQIGLAVISLLACLLQFYIGRRVGRPFGDMISAGQGMGQKNTVLAIWMGYTFFDPVTSLAAGFYMLWHNLVNTFQLRKSLKSKH